MRGRWIKQAAFTLVELMIAVAIFTALAMVVYPAYKRSVDRARTAQAVRDIGQLSMAIERRRTVTRSYPNALGELSPNLPRTDPWGYPYRYLPIDTIPRPPTGAVRRDRNLNPLNRDFDLYSVGPDGRTQTQLSGAAARDDVVRAGNGSFIGRGEDH